MISMKIKKIDSKCSCGYDFTRQLNTMISSYQDKIDDLKQEILICSKCKKNWQIGIEKGDDQYNLTLSSMGGN